MIQINFLFFFFCLYYSSKFNWNISILTILIFVYRASYFSPILGGGSGWEEGFILVLFRFILSTSSHGPLLHRFFGFFIFFAFRKGNFSIIFERCFNKAVHSLGIKTFAFHQCRHNRHLHYHCHSYHRFLCSIIHIMR